MIDDYEHFINGYWLIEIIFFFTETSPCESYGSDAVAEIKLGAWTFFIVLKTEKERKKCRLQELVFAVQPFNTESHGFQLHFAHTASAHY